MENDNEKEEELKKPLPIKEIQIPDKINIDFITEV